MMGAAASINFMPFTGGIVFLWGGEFSREYKAPVTAATVWLMQHNRKIYVPPVFSALGCGPV